MTFRPTEATLFIEKAAAPAVTDDQNEGYLVGDIWIDETNDKSYQCLDNTVDAAVWLDLSGVVFSGNLSDLVIDSDMDWQGFNITNLGAGGHNLNTLLGYIDQDVKVAASPGFANLTIAGELTLKSNGLRIYDGDKSDLFTVFFSSNLTDTRTLNIVTGDANRTLTLNGNSTLNDWFDQSVKATAKPTFAGIIDSSGTGLTVPLPVTTGQIDWFGACYVGANPYGLAFYVPLTDYGRFVARGNTLDCFYSELYGANIGDMQATDGTRSLFYDASLSRLIIADATYTSRFSSQYGLRVSDNRPAFVSTTYTAAGMWFMLTGLVGYKLTDAYGAACAQFGADGTIVCGLLSALATNATTGFLYIPTCAGAPTGTPTTYTGKVAMVFDTTNNNLYIYDGSWISTALA